MQKKLSCRCCRSTDLYKYLNLGKQPLANSYHKNELLPTFPLEVMLCKHCFHSQLSVVVDPDVMFKNYLYVSGTTETFRTHCKNLAQDAVKRLKKKKLEVLDIACNDGTQLAYFRELGCTVFGVDPAENLREITAQKNIDVEVAYWNRKTAKKLRKSFDIITATNVFAHVDDLDEFLKATEIVLKDDGILILEFPYGDQMIEKNEFDTVYHEHLSYFLVNSVSTLLSRLDFYIIDILQTSIHGGSIRFFIKKGKKPHADIVNTSLLNERKSGLLKQETYKQFAMRVKKNKKDITALVKELKQKHKKVVGYGAAAKGNTMLNYFRLNLDYIVDDNELKWGFKTPGRNIQIVSPEELSKENNELFIIILSWNFYSEIKKRIKKLKQKKTTVSTIRYVPQMLVEKV